MAFTIRPFEDYIDLIDTWSNFVFAASKRKLGIFLVDEEDPENDNDELRKGIVELPSDIKKMKYIPQRNQLVIVCDQIVVFEIKQLDKVEFTFKEIYTSENITIQRPFIQMLDDLVVIT